MVESLRALLRVLSVHEKEIYRVTTENKFMLEFIFSQIPNNISHNAEFIDGKTNPFDEEAECVEGVVEHDFDGGEWSAAAEWRSSWDDEIIAPLEDGVDSTKIKSGIDSTSTAKKRKQDKS